MLAAWSVPAAIGQTYTYSTLAGFAGRAGYSGGVGIEPGKPLFSSPTGLVVNGTDGNIYVADSGNSLIRTLTPAGVVTTLAGTLGIYGSTDGTKTAASFSVPQGPAVDSAGNMYVADYGSSIIRKITKDGVVTTIAGTANSVGVADGTGAAARFRNPTAVAVDNTTGNIYVADAGNNTIRKITSAGVVTTLAGTAGAIGSLDGTGTAALFRTPRGLATDSAGNVYVADSGNNTIRKITPTGDVTIVAGAPDTYGSTDGVGTAARFSFPNSIIINQATGTMYVADRLNHTIRVITKTAGSPDIYTVGTLAGSPGTAGALDGTGAAAQFSHPSGVAIDGAGNIYVADYYNQLIRKVSPAGVVTTVAGAKGLMGSQDGTGYTLAPDSIALFRVPSATATDASGTVYVADTGNNAIRAITPAGVVSTLAGHQTAGRVDGDGLTATFDGPTGVALDNSGNVYVADANNNLIRMVTPAGQVTTIAGTGGVSGSADGSALSATFDLPGNIAWDSTTGSLYVSDYNNSTIRRISSSGVVSTFAGTAGTVGHADGTGSAATFSHPRDLAVDSGGNVYVADSGNHAIRKITPAGQVTTLAGTAGTAGSADGTGTAARFNGPAGLAVDNSGFLYVADTNNSLIRRVSPAGVVTTIGGTSGVQGTTDGAGTTALFDHPTGISLDGAGNLYIADNRNHTIRKGISSGGTSGEPGLTGGSGSSTGGTSGGGGSGSGGSGGGSPGTGGTGVAAVLHPSGLVFDASGNLYIADTANNCIKKVATDLTVAIFAGQSGKAGSSDGTGTGALFNGPVGLTADSAGNIYVCDTGNGTIRKITSAGVVTTLAGSAGSRGTTDGTGSAALFSNPTGIVLAGSGNLFVTDTTNCTIRQITSAGVVTTFAGAAKVSGDLDASGTAARFNNPTGMTIDSTNALYVADTYNHTIRKVTTGPITAVATAVGEIQTAGNATVIVTDAALTGSPITVTVAVLAGDLASAWATKVAAALNANTTIAARYTAGSSGNVIYLTALTADVNDTTLNISLDNGTGSGACTGITPAPTSVATPTGRVTTLAGSAGISGAYDGTGEYALFNAPSGVAISSTGYVFVADTGNSCIRQISSLGVVSTVAGIAGVSGNRDGAGASALFNQPQAVFVATSSIVVADTGNSLIRLIGSTQAVTTAALKEPTTPTTPTPTPSSGGGGGMEPWFAGALLALGGAAMLSRRRLARC